MKKVLIAIQNDTLAEQTLKQGLELAKLANATVGLVYVVDASFYVGDAGYTVQDYIRDSHNEAKALFERLKADYSITDNWAFIEDGKPFKKIIEAAQEWQANYIVTGTHGHIGLAHFFEGSVAEHLIRHSTVPVLVVPPASKNKA